MPKLLNIFRKIKYYYSLLTLNNVHKILLGKVKESKKKKKEKELAWVHVEIYSVPSGFRYCASLSCHRYTLLPVDVKRRDAGREQPSPHSYRSLEVRASSINVGTNEPSPLPQPPRQRGKSPSPWSSQWEYPFPLVPAAHPPPASSAPPN